MIFALFFTLCLTNTALSMELASTSQEALVQVQLQDVRMCIEHNLAKALTSLVNIVAVADGSFFLPITFAQWKLLEPYFKLVVKEQAHPSRNERLRKRAQRLCNISCGKQLADLKIAAEKIQEETLLGCIERTERKLTMMQDCTINDNDVLTLVTSDWKKVRVCLRLARLSRTLAAVVRQAEGGLEPISLTTMDHETWGTIRQLLSRYYRLQRKKEGASARHAFTYIKNCIASLDENRLMKLLIAVNYLDIPLLFEQTRLALTLHNRVSGSHELILKLPTGLRNQLIIKRLVEALGSSEESSCKAYRTKVQNEALVSIAPAEKGLVWACVAGKEEMHSIGLETGNGFKVRLPLYSSAYLLKCVSQEKFITANSDWTFSIRACNGCQLLKVYNEPAFHSNLARTNDMCLGLDGCLFTCHEDGCVRVWYAETDKEVRQLVCDSDFYYRSNILSLCLVHDGQPYAKIAAGSVTGAVLIWDRVTENFFCICDDADQHAEPVYTICCNDEGHIFAGSCDGSVRVWDSKSGMLLQRWHMKKRISAMSGALEGAVICGLADGEVNIVDSATGIVIMRCLGAKGWVTSLALSHDMKLFVAASSPEVAIYEYDLALIKALRNMDIEQAKEILASLHLREIQERNPQQALMWATITTILGCRVLPVVEPSSQSVCMIQ